MRAVLYCKLMKRLIEEDGNENFIKNWWKFVAKFASICYKLLSAVSSFINIGVICTAICKKRLVLGVASLPVSIMKICALSWWCLQLQNVTLKKIIFVASWTAGIPMSTGLLVEGTFGILSLSSPKTTHLTVNWVSKKCKTEVLWKIWLYDPLYDSYTANYYVSCFFSPGLGWGKNDLCEKTD